MAATADEVFSAALELPDAERIELIELLIDSVQPADRPPLDEAWRDVIRRRSAELVSGSVTAVPWSEVKRRAREKAGG